MVIEHETRDLLWLDLQQYIANKSRFYLLFVYSFISEMHSAPTSTKSTSCRTFLSSRRSTPSWRSTERIRPASLTFEPYWEGHSTGSSTRAWMSGCMHWQTLGTCYKQTRWDSSQFEILRICRSCFIHFWDLGWWAIFTESNNALTICFTLIHKIKERLKVNILKHLFFGR